jgi:ATP-dependent DNA ligase
MVYNSKIHILDTTMASVHTHVTDFTSLPGESRQLAWYFPELTIVGKKKSYWQIVVSAEVDGKVVDILPYLNNVLGVNVVGRIDVLSRLQRNSGGSTVRDAVSTYVTSGKNVGRKTETNAVCQAMRDAYGLHLKKSKSTTDFIPPMLAQIYKDQRTHKFPVYVQPKYNGLRCVASCVNGDVILQSRTGGLYPGLDYIRDEIKGQLALGANLRLDGELYFHGMSLQDISGVARGDRNDVVLNYVIYDICDLNNLEMLYGDRKTLVENVLGAAKNLKYLQLTPTVTVQNDAELQTEYKKYIGLAYEGAMVRLNAPYEPGYNNYHSKWLLKIKPCLDSEYPLVGWEVGLKGKAKNALMTICSVGTKQFTVTPAMELEERYALAKQWAQVEANGKTHFENHYKGRPMTVYYDELSDAGVPLRARTKLEFTDRRI